MPHRRRPDEEHGELDGLSRAQILADLIYAGWRPPTVTTDQCDRVLDDMRDLTQQQTLDLTRRETDALQLAAKGLTRTEIAEATGKEPDTAKQALDRARAKLGARNVTHAVALAIGQGMIEAPER